MYKERGRSRLSLNKNVLFEENYDVENTPYSLLDSLEQVFSVLPEQQASEAQQLTLKKISGNNGIANSPLSWADFDESGRFKSGGVTDIAGSYFRRMKDVSQEPDIADLVKVVEEGGLKAGLMEYSPAKNAILWFVPSLMRSAAGLPESTYRGIFITEPIIHELLNIFNHEALISKAEKHLIFQLAAGMTLRSAADIDGLKIETKRTQLKSICSKLQCGGQNDLLRHILGQLVYFFSLTNVKNNRSASLSDFVDKFLFPDTRIVEQRLSNNRIMRVLERGPTNGKPLLIIHGMLWPLRLMGPAKLLKEKNIRMIVPIRSGYIEEKAYETSGNERDLVEQSIQDIALYQQECLDSKMTILGMSYGGAIALKYASQFPHLISKLFIVSFNPAVANAVNKNFLGKLFNGLRSLPNRSGIFRPLAWQFKKYYANEKTVNPILHKIHTGSQSDLDLISGKLGQAPLYPVFVRLFQNSILGISDDFQFVSSDIKALSKDVNIAVTFIHGSNDSMIDVNVVKKYVDNMQRANLKTIDKAGHHLFNTHEHQFWQIIDDQLSPSDK